MAAVMDVYVRVSRKGGREGEAYRSPGIQTDECRRWAEREGITVGKVVKNEDVSGAKAIKDRGLEELIARAEAGVSAGVVVYALDRFGRDELDAALAIRRLSEVGARLVSTSEGIDSSRTDPGSKMALKLHLMFAEAYLDRVKQNWKDTTERAIGEGIHITGKPSVGYVRKDRVEPIYNEKGELVPNGRLVVEPHAAEVVRELFEMRARGSSFGEITKRAEERLDRPFGKSTVRQWVRNRVYLGEARRGATVNPDAHEAIVTPELFAAANRPTAPRKPRSVLTSKALLTGLVRCAGCGHSMGVVGSGVGKGRKPFYVCAKHFATGRCEGAAALATLVDDLVIDQLGGAWEQVIAASGSEEQRYLIARERLQASERELEALIQDTDYTHETRRRLILKAEKEIEEARAEMYSLPDPGLDDAPIVWLDGKPHAYTLWGEDRDRDRRLLRKYVKAVRVAKADPKRRRWQPIHERVSIEWIGGVEIDTSLADAFVASEAAA
jgi:DNA invertase Pin-like site-specific DNA recombinase